MREIWSCSTIAACCMDEPLSTPATACVTFKAAISTSTDHAAATGFCGARRGILGAALAHNCDFHPDGAWYSSPLPTVGQFVIVPSTILHPGETHDGAHAQVPRSRVWRRRTR